MTFKGKQAIIPDPWFGTDDPDDKSGSSRADFLIGLGGNDTLRGLGGGDTLNGQKGADKLYGGAGADRIYASGGDRVWGGAGSDVFVLLDSDRLPDITDPGRAVIKDFDAVGADHDRLDLSNFATQWADRDAGLDDGFELVKSGANVIMRLAGLSGAVTTVVFENTRLADLDLGDFLFGT